jgi:hypothetical protein
MEDLERDMQFFALLARVQVIDTTMTALIQSHPDPEALREMMEMNYSLLLSTLSTGLVGAGKSASGAETLRQMMDANLALLDPDDSED